MSIGGEADLRTCEHELTGNGKTKGNYQIRIYLTDVIGSADHQKNAKFEIRVLLTLQKLMLKLHQIISPELKLVLLLYMLIKKCTGKISKSDITWYVPFFTAKFLEQNPIYSKFYLDQQQY